MHRNQPQSSLSTARSRLAALGENKPRTKAAQLRLLWPEIKAALDQGHTLKAVCECLEADGLEMSIYTLGSYVARMRRSSGQSASLGARTPIRGTSDPIATSVATESTPDPLVNLRKSESKGPAFDYRPELADPDKLI